MKLTMHLVDVGSVVVNYILQKIERDTRHKGTRDLQFNLAQPNRWFDAFIITVQ